MNNCDTKCRFTIRPLKTPDGPMGRDHPALLMRALHSLRAFWMLSIRSRYKHVTLFLPGNRVTRIFIGYDQAYGWSRVVNCLNSFRV